MTDRSVAHGTFVIDRTYPASASRIFKAWADPEIKKRWFGGGGEGSQIFEFREGGREYAEGKGPDGGAFTFDVLYQDIVDANRIIYTYQMSLNGKRISVSVAAIELFPDGSNTRMQITEHGCFLDGLDTVEIRKQGTEWLVDSLGKELERQGAN